MNLIFDMNNLCHVHFYGNKEADDDVWLGMTFQSTFHDMKNIFKKFKPDRIVLAFDATSWRKLYTRDLSNCVTHMKYKGGRYKNKTPKELKRKKTLDDEIHNLREMLYEHTSHVVLHGKYLEADDLIAGYVQLHRDEDHVIISSDRDFMQLIDDNVKLYDPVSDDFRNLDEWHNDPKLFLFEKCFRGDSGDFVISSYPRIRKDKIFEAYKDDFVKNNVMEHEYKMEYIDDDGILQTYNYVTRDVFEENIFLMGLDSQPDNIKDLIKEVVNTEKDKKKTFSMFKFLKFCGKYDLPLIIKNAEDFIPLFNL